MMQKTDFPFEVIIHDDASTDGTTDIIREYEAKYPDIIKPIYQTENKYSKGIKIMSEIQFPQAKGKYIAMCEGDDYWIDPLKLQKQVDFLEKHPEYSLCFHAVKIKNEDQLDVWITQSLEEREYSGPEILKSWTIPTCSAVFRAEMRDKHRSINRKYNFIFGDIILWLTCAEIGKLYCMNQCMGVYRIHKSGMAQTYFDEARRMNNTYFIGKTFRSCRSYTNPIYARYLARKGFNRITGKHDIMGVTDIIKGVYVHPGMIKNKLLNLLGQVNGKQ